MLNAAARFSLFLSCLFSLAIAPGTVASGATADPSRSRPPSADPSRLAVGKLLVAARQLADPNFAESVVLLLEYGPRGAMGVIINRPTDVNLSSLLPEVEELRGAPYRAFEGGPVGRTGMLLLLRGKEPAVPSVRVLEDVYASGSAELLRTWTARGDDTLRAYVGYAGWGAGQLEAEVKRGDWYVSAGDAAKVFASEPDRLWRRLVETLEGQWACNGGVVLE